MLKWIRITENQYLGFWILGLVLFIIQEIPYMAMPFMHLETNPIMEIQEKSIILNICEKILGSMCIAAMVFIVHENASVFSVEKTGIYFYCALAVILLNFTGWGIYFSGRQSMAVMMFFLVVLPPLYYIFIGLWRNNSALAVIGCLFLIAHTANVWNNLR